MISHRHKTIFVHIPKCAGQSVERMFLEDQGLTWSERDSLLLRANADRTLGPPRLAHLLASDYTERGHISSEKFSAYFKFAIVRDPYDRALSLYNYLQRPRRRSLIDKLTAKTRFRRLATGGKALNLDQFFNDYLPRMFADGEATDSPSRYWFVRAQSDYIFDANGASLVDEIIRFEELNERVDALRARCGINAAFGHANKSARRVSRHALRARYLDIIEDLYRKDFEALAYYRQER